MLEFPKKPGTSPIVCRAKRGGSATPKAAAAAAPARAYGPERFGAQTKASRGRRLTGSQQRTRACRG